MHTLQTAAVKLMWHIELTMSPYFNISQCQNFVYKLFSVTSSLDMPEKFIQPAIDITEDADISKGLSAHDFQKHLYGWFQERGMLCELRAYLRKQMIGALQNSTMGHVVTDQQNQILSPIVQATNLLVSEFLFHFNYHYSLSVFTTEVPLINILPELPISLDTKHAQKGKEWKFTEKDTRDILETLGVMGESEIGKKILESYIDSEPQSLLMCIINSIKLINKTGLLNENLFACNTYEEWIRNVGELLQFNNISVPNIKDVLSTVMTLVETERKQLRTQAREEYMKVEARLQKECDKNKEEQKKNG
ncbi:hypothetical protein FQA39_LY17247 [Lamprigera yunnana]|nr:hypothetical protein FQA39_LY17247 [Lamprigera yunnana]